MTARSLLALALGACVALAVAPSARTADLGLYDPTAHATDPGRFWTDVRDLGVTVLRDDVFAGEVAPTMPARPADPADPAYAWGTRRSLVLDEARARGVRVYLTLDSWASWMRLPRPPGYSCRRSLVNPAALARFAQAVMARYPYVSALEVGNETNMAGVWCGDDASREALWKNTADATTAVYRVARPRGVETYLGAVYRGYASGQPGEPWGFMRSLRRYDPQFDVLTVHPYSTRWDQWGAAVDGTTVDPANLARWMAHVEHLWGSWRDVPGWKAVKQRRLVRRCRWRSAARVRAGGGRATAAGRVRRCRRAVVSRWVQEPVVSSRWVPGKVRFGISEMGWQTVGRATPEVVAPHVERWIAAMRRSSRIEFATWFLTVDQADGWQTGLREEDGTEKPLRAAWLRGLR